MAVLRFVAPASADTIANFTLDGVTFGDGGTATGSFTLDLDTSTLSNVNITTSSNIDSMFAAFGATYNDSSTNIFTNGTTAQFEFDNFYYYFPVFFPTGEDSLVIDLPGPLTPANLAGSSSFAASGSESEYFFLCGGGGLDFCGARTITAGTLDTGLSATPLPATLPLFAGGLGFVGYLARRRKRSEKKVLATA